MSAASDCWRSPVSRGSWIVEDDYDSEFRFSGQPIPALQGLVPDAPVVYIGTFSKTLYPGLRLGYVVIPRPLVSDLKHAHAELYRGGHSLIQMALAEFITAGHYFGPYPPYAVALQPSPRLF
ncbi:transcriptional regulator GabR [Klebsiella variicola]|uniref:Transcriptional regulator GabR n=1 Tax=Klebsiella variicola TaxID=244366 RepID=A0A7H4M952_KLEVA|nr:transcriptional regulator GabR [Klebsiella variicola]